MKADSDEWDMNSICMPSLLLILLVCLVVGVVYCSYREQGGGEEVHHVRHKPVHIYRFAPEV